MIGVIYLPIVIGLGFTIIPTEKKVYRGWSHDLIQFAINNDPKLKNKWAWDIREAYSDLNDKELIEKIQKKLIQQNVFHKFDIEKITQKYQPKIKNMQVIQLKTIGIGALIWIVPMLVLYIFGCSVGWIYRGFKKA